MSQAIFKDPIVSSAPVRTGTGTGTLTVDRLTHFTINQTYTCICIAKTPDTLFSISGDQDGPVGIATAGVQFYDQDLKVFLTIQQGATVFEVGDQFVFTVQQGTDLNQTNIDSYDEIPQKNFGAGIKGQEKGDNNIRYSDADVYAELYLQDILIRAASAGSAGNSIQVEYDNPSPAAPASLTLQDLTFTAVTPGIAGNSITMAYEDYTPATRAFLTIGNLKYSSQAHGAAANAISIAYQNDGTAGSETVSVVGTAITVHIQSGVSTAAQIQAAIAASVPASALVFTDITPLTAGANPQTVTMISAPVTWTNRVGVTGSLQKNTGVDTWGDSGAFSVESINGDGYLQVKANQTNKDFMVGLSLTDPDQNFASIKYALDFASDGNVYSYEAGVSTGSNTPYTTSDVFSVEVQGTTVQYKKNGTPWYTSANPASFPLFADVSFFSNGAGLNSATLAGSGVAENLAGGANAIGDAGNEVVTVVGTAIQVQLQSGVSTATQVKSKLDASIAASALISTAISGTGSNTQTAPAIPVPTNLAGGHAAYGYFGSELAQVVGNLVKVYFESSKSTALSIVNAINTAASSLVVASIIGFSAKPQVGPMSATNLAGGKDKYFALNKHELSDSGSFVEGNASLSARNADLAGRLKVAGHAELEGALLLDEPSSGPAVTNAQQTINDLIQNQKLTLRTADGSKVSWAAPVFSFTANIVIGFPDTGFSNTILASNSPITVADGESIYCLLDRTGSANVTPVISSTLPKYDNAFRLLTRYGSSIIFWNGMLLRDGHSARIGEGGDTTFVRATLHDASSTVKPTVTPVVIDDQTLVDGDSVLFTNLAAGSNRIYTASISGGSITWTAASIFSTGVAPVTGDDILILTGTSYGLQRGTFDGSVFRFSKIIRQFDGAYRYSEREYADAIALPSPTTTVLSALTFDSRVYKTVIIDYTIVEAATNNRRGGRLLVNCDGAAGIAATLVDCVDTYGETADVGVTMSASVSGNNIQISSTTLGANAKTMQVNALRFLA